MVFSSQATGTASITYQICTAKIYHISAFAFSVCLNNPFCRCWNEAENGATTGPFPTSWYPPLSNRSFYDCHECRYSQWSWMLVLTMVMNVDSNLYVPQLCPYMLFFSFLFPLMKHAEMRGRVHFAQVNEGIKKRKQSWVQATTSSQRYILLQCHPDFFCRLKGDMEHQRKAVESSIQKVNSLIIVTDDQL